MIKIHKIFSIVPPLFPEIPISDNCRLNGTAYTCVMRLLRPGTGDPFRSDKKPLNFGTTRFPPKAKTIEH